MGRLRGLPCRTLAFWLHRCSCFWPSRAHPPPRLSTRPHKPRSRRKSCGDLAMARQQYVTAIDSYRRASQDSPDVWNKLGMAFHHLFAMDEAKRAYEHALHLRPQYPEALNNLGAVYYAEKNYRKAVRYYRKAVALDPQSATMYSNLGTAWFAEQRYEGGPGRLPESLCPRSRRIQRLRAFSSPSPCLRPAAPSRTIASPASTPSPAKPPKPLIFSAAHSMRALEIARNSLGTRPSPPCALPRSSPAS